jgi:prevent-host-death family protein
MTNRISSFNAKTHFSNLLSQVQNGSEFIITKHNHIVAKLIPIIEENENIKIANIIKQIKINRQNYLLKLKGGIEKLRTEGRR